MMRRPSSVPRSARYSTRDCWWQVGEIKNERPFGPWRTFREDGSPLFEARFDSKGRLQGTFRRFHPDGSLAREATYARGVLTGQLVLHRAKGAAGDVFPSSDPRVWQVVVRYDSEGAETSRVALDDRGRELVGGEPPSDSAGSLDAVFATATPDGFLASGTLPRVIAELGAATAAPVDDFLLPSTSPARRPLDAKRFQDLYGRPIQPDLKAWLDAFAASPSLLGLRIARDNDLAVEGNLAEALILEHQDAPGRVVGLRTLVSGVLSIADSSDGRLRYCLSLGESSNGSTDAVYAILPDEDAIQQPVARTLDDFAYAVALTSASDVGAVSLRSLQQAYERLRGRVDLRAPMTDVEARALGDDEDDEVVGDPEKDHREGFHFRRPNPPPGYFYYRNRWLLRLLCGHAEGAAADFDLKYDGGLDDARFEIVKKNAREPWVAFYWLFRSLVFDDPRLDALLRVCSDTPSQLGRDIAALVAELARGRKQLGAIADFGALKQRFLALDPMAPKATEADADDEEDEDAEQEGLDVPEELAAAATVIDWARNNGYSRDNLLIKDEVDAAALGLALRADPAIVPHIAKLLDDAPWLGSRFLAPWLDGDRADLAALAPMARDWLRDRESGAVYRWQSGTAVLARVGTRDDAALIADVLGPALDGLFGRGQGFEAAMGMMVLQEALGPITEALATLGVPESFVATLEGVASAESHLVDDARGPCALALAAAGCGLDAIVTGLRGQLERKHGHRITPGQLVAVGQLGKHAPERRSELVALVETIPRISDEAKSGQLCALRDLGVELDLAAGLREELEKKRYKDKDTAKQRAAILELIAGRTDVPADLAVPYVRSDYLPLHRAATRTLRARGLPVPETCLYDPYYLAQLDRDQLHAALADEHAIYRSNVALWLSDHPDEASRDALIANARRIAALGDFPDEGPAHYELRWTIRALLRIGGAEAVLDELLVHSDRKLAEPVLRYPDELTSGVARGMAYVFANDKHWRHNVAKSWLVAHKTDPAIATALAEHGLALEDVTRSGEEG